MLLNDFIREFKNARINTDDGVRVDFKDHWVHLRKSNTEPIIRIITEAGSRQEADDYAEKYLKLIAGLKN
jgi:phosphomannomutase